MAKRVLKSRSFLSFLKPNKKLILQFFVALIVCVVSIFAYLISVTESTSSSDILEGVIRKENYPFETHTVVTEDNYLLTVHRIPGPPGSTPVYLQHGLLSSSADWVMVGKNKSFPFILSDNGYDVWIGNARGNQFSLAHQTLSPSDSEYWNFSWSELGMYDVPAVIMYIKSMTKNKIFYVGHSMGCSTFSVMASERPDVANNVKAMMALAPATYEYNIKHPLVRIVAKNWSKFQVAAKSLGVNRLLSRNFFFDLLAKNGDSMNVNFFYLIDGVRPLPEDDGFPNFVENFPSGTSVKLFAHWLQQMNVNEFQKFDYGTEINMKMYGSPDPPKYDLSKIQVPVAVFYSDKDLITVSEDVEHYYEQLPVKIGLYKIDDLAHSDFLWRDRTVKEIYLKILDIFKKYETF